MTMNLNFSGKTDRRLFFFDTETTGLPRDWNAAILAGELDSHQIATR